MSKTQKPIGGFFELELPQTGTLYHDRALALANGRVCFKALLGQVQPSKVYVPFYACHSLLLPLEEQGIPYSFYGIDEKLDPEVPPVGDTELFVYINYFGIKNETARKLSGQLGSKLVMDNTQAFFGKSHGNGWAFNSARKFFGVPDGGFLYSPEELGAGYPPNGSVIGEHLMLRHLGKQSEAFAWYQRSEAGQTLELRGMSDISRKILYGVDFPAVARARRHNFRALHEALRPLNAVSEDLLELDAEAVPFCYPFLPSNRIPHGVFHEAGIYVPMLWQEVLDRGIAGYGFEKYFADNLLALPVDHRVDTEDIGRMVALILEHSSHKRSKK